MIPGSVELLRALGVRVGPLWSTTGTICACPARGSCASPGKHPVATAVPRGVHDFAHDATAIGRWAGELPGCNWGAAVPPGAVVIDVDARSGGLATLAGWEAEHGLMPATLRAATGGGGWHLWFAGVSTVGKLAGGIDVKKPGGYLVLPPSVHVSGRPYRWDTVANVAALPDWLAELLNPPAPTRVVSKLPPRAYRDPHRGVLRALAEAAEGERNSMLFWAATRVAESGSDPAAVLGDTARSIGLSETEIHKTIGSATRTANRAGAA